MGKQFVICCLLVFFSNKTLFSQKFSMYFLPFSRTVNAQITLENHVLSNVDGSVNIMKYKVFQRLQFFALRRRVVIGDSLPKCGYSHAFFRICHSIIVRKMVCIPIFIGVYTVYHLDIYIYIYFSCSLEFPWLQAPLLQSDFEEVLPIAAFTV